jgi:hypothetical protein
MDMIFSLAIANEAPEPHRKKEGKTLMMRVVSMRKLMEMEFNLP